MASSFIVLVDFINQGLHSEQFGQHTSATAQDDLERRFDLASLDMHQGADDMFSRRSLYTPIQLGPSTLIVLDFEVAGGPQGLHLVPVP